MRLLGAAMPAFVEIKEGDNVMAQRLLTAKERAKDVLDFLKVHRKRRSYVAGDIHTPLKSLFGPHFSSTGNKSSMNASTGSANQRGYRHEHQSCQRSKCRCRRWRAVLLRLRVSTIGLAEIAQTETKVTAVSVIGCVCVGVGRHGGGRH
jgi:hypothetical protein